MAGVMGDLPTHFDVVVHASARQQNSEWHVARAGVTVNTAEKRKRSVWGADALSRCPARIAPLAWETQGRWGKTAVEELTRLAKIRAAIVHEPGVEASALATASLRRWRRRLSVTLQRGNAQAFLACSGTPAAPPLEDIGFILDPHGS